MSERDVDIDERLEQLANSYSMLSGKSQEESMHVMSSNDNTCSTTTQETNYSVLRVIVSFIVCFIAEIIIYALVMTLAAIIIYTLAKIPILRFLLTITLGVDFCLESFSMIISLSITHVILTKLLPDAYVQQNKCIFVYSIITIIFGALNFIPSFFKGFNADSRTVGLIQVIAGILMIRYSRTELEKYK